ncbi:MAG TPA: LuxR C-terminal-related transcriptional regulator [Vicinamibacterales bacterium]|nr:LuxR C-terminal-related transcriptional regulator [Vicinamibacterales bacterium]
MLHITPSERQALRLLAQDNPITEVAQALGVSTSAVDLQLGVLFARMGVSGKAEAVESAARRGLLVLEPDRSAKASACAGPLLG